MAVRSANAHLAGLFRAPPPPPHLGELDAEHALVELNLESGLCDLRRDRRALSAPDHRR